MTPGQMKQAFELIEQLAGWTTCDEDDFEWTDDPYVDNTLADLDVLIRKARAILNPTE